MANFRHTPDYTETGASHHGNYFFKVRGRRQGEDCERLELYSARTKGEALALAVHRKMVEVKGVERGNEVCGDLARGFITDAIIRP